MEPLRSESRTILEKISPNLASVIAQYLTMKDLISLSSCSSHLRVIFYEFDSSWKAVLTNYKIPESIIITLKSLEDLKAIWKNKMIKLLEGNGYLRLNENQGKASMVFPGSEIPYDWRGSEYWPLHSHKDSWFGETPIPHLMNVCWFRMEGCYVIPRGKYSLSLRILADHNFHVNNSYFFLLREGSAVPLFKFVFTKEIENQLIQKAEFTVLKIGEFDLSDFPENEVKVTLKSQEEDSWWKQGFWLDAIVFTSI